MAHICEVRDDCLSNGIRRACGHYACDGHTDEATEQCLWCVPVYDEDYGMAVEQAQQGAWD